MRRLTPKTIATVAAAIAVAGAGTAIAAGGDSVTSPSTFLDAVAKHLGISSEKLQDATKAAAIDQVDARLKAGEITQEQADAMKERIESSDVPFFGMGPGMGHGPGFGHGPGMGGHMADAAEYLGLTESELMEQLAAGKSLADVAKAEGKSVDGLEQVLIASEKAELDQAVEDGRLTQAQANELLAERKERIDDIVAGTFQPGGHRGHMGGHMGGGPMWSTPGGESGTTTPSLYSGPAI